MNPYDREQFILKMTGSSAREKSFCQILSITFGIPKGRLSGMQMILLSPAERLKMREPLLRKSMSFLSLVD